MNRRAAQDGMSLAEPENEQLYEVVLEQALEPAEVEVDELS